MSTQGRMAHPVRCTRTHSRRKIVLNVDLNVAPSCENADQQGTSVPVVSGDVQHGQRVASLTPAPVDVEALDDDVIISSPREFEEAKNNCRRNRGRVVVIDVDSEDRSFWVTVKSRNKRRRDVTNQATTSGDIHINLEESSSSNSVDLRRATPLQPKELTFSCPVCMGPLVEETSTKCGHIFCKACINASIAAQGKCPTCRRKITVKNTIRVYLPTTS